MVVELIVDLADNTSLLVSNPCHYEWR